MEPIVNKIHKLLLKNKQTLAVAESCTGGMLSDILTQSSGSSGYFILGLVAYSNSAKKTILGVPSSVIDQKGAVSREVALKMAGNIKKISKTDFGIGITGIAGPTGGTLQKPIGMVFIAVASKNKAICERFHFKGNRSAIRKKSALKALELLMKLLKNESFYCYRAAPTD